MSVGGDGFRDELDRRLGRHLRGAGAHHVAGLPPRDDQADDRGHQEDGERDHALGQDRHVLDRAVEHRPARVGDAGPSHRRARRTGVRHRSRRLADHLERPAHGRAAQERVARADPQPRRRRTADRHRELLGLQLEAQRLLVVLDREAQVDGRVAPVHVADLVAAGPPALGGHGGDRPLQVEHPADLEVTLLDDGPLRVQRGDRPDAERQRLVRRAARSPAA